MLMIMAGHVSGTMHTVILTPLGGAGVALFLFISGYGVSESLAAKGLRHYWRGKILRVVLPYALCITVIALARHLFADGAWHPAPPTATALRGYLLDLCGWRTSYWFIGFLLRWYLVFWLAARFAPRRRLWILLASAAFVHLTSDSLEAEQSCSFLAGALASHHKARLDALTTRHRLGWGLALGVAAMACLAIKQLPGVRAHFGDTLYDTVQSGIKLPAALALTALLSLTALPVRSRLLALAGTVSYELYLVHIPFYAALDGSLWQAALLFAGSFAAAWLFHRLNTRISRALS